LHHNDTSGPDVSKMRYNFWTSEGNGQSQINDLDLIDGIDADDSNDALPDSMQVLWDSMLI